MVEKSKQRKHRLVIAGLVVLAFSLVVSFVSMRPNYIEPGWVLGETTGDEFGYSKWTCSNGDEHVSNESGCVSLGGQIMAAVGRCGGCESAENCGLDKILVKQYCKGGVLPCTDIDIEGNCESTSVTPTTSPTPEPTITPSATPTPTAEPTPTPITSINLIRNFGFEQNRNEWNWYSNGDGSFKTVSPGRNSENAAMIIMEKSGRNVQLYQTGVPVKPNTKYSLSFDAKANKNMTFSVYLHKHKSPYSNYGLDYSATPTTEWTRFETSFTTTSNALSDARLRFWLSGQVGALDLDNISLVEINN